MIITKKKDFEEILFAIGDTRSLFLLGCGDCATLCKTGGEPELKEMSQKLVAKGIAVTGTAVVPAACHELDTKRVLRKHKDEVDKAQAVLALICGAGVQSVGDNTDKPAYSGCDSLFIGNSKRQLHYYEKCSACGECVLNDTAGLCPETRCPKSLLNGPCGGAVGGKCEVNSENLCVWIDIYNRLKKAGKLENLLLKISAPKDNSGLAKPQKLELKREPGR